MPWLKPRRNLSSCHLIYVACHHQSPLQCFPFFKYTRDTLEIKLNLVPKDHLAVNFVLQNLDKFFLKSAAELDMKTALDTATLIISQFLVNHQLIVDWHINKQEPCPEAAGHHQSQAPDCWLWCCVQFAWLSPSILWLSHGHCPRCPLGNAWLRGGYATPERQWGYGLKVLTSLHILPLYQTFLFRATLTKKERFASCFLVYWIVYA